MSSRWPSRFAGISWLTATMCGRALQECDQFCFFDHPIRDMRGSTLGIVGYGAIGKAVARIAEAFGQKVLAYDIFRKLV